MTAPLRFSEMAAAMPDPIRAKKADRWDQLKAAHPTWDQATLDQAVEQEFATSAKAAPAIARRGESGIASQITQGASFGFGDEANALLDTVTDKARGRESRPFGEAYRANADAERARLEMYREQNGGKSMLAQIAGGVLTGGGVNALGRTALLRGGAAAGKAVAGGEAIAGAPGFWARVGKGAAEGAGYGALGGAGNSEGNDASVMLKDAGTGALVGGGIGGGLPMLGGLLGLTGRAAVATKNAIKPPTQSAAISADMAAAPSTALAVPSAAAKPVVSSGALPTTDSALLRVARAMRQDKMTPDALRAASASARPGEIIADVAGEQTQRLVRGAEALPSAGASEIATTLRGRQSEQGQRVAKGIAEAFGVADEVDLTAAAKSLEATRKAASARAYREAYEVAPGEPRTISSALLQPYMDDPVFQKAMARARQQFDLDMRTGDAPTSAPIFRDVVTGVGPDGMPTVQLAEQIPVAVVDYLKRGLDAVIETGADGRPLDRTMARSYRQLKNRLLAEVDAEVPEFAAARQTFAGGIAMEEALQAGQQATKRGLSRSELAAQIADLSQGEAEQFRLGALGALLEDAANVSDGRDVMATIAKSPALREKIALLLPDDAARESFADLVKSEGRMTATRRTIQGSRTAPLLQDVAALTDDGTPEPQTIGRLFSGGVANAAGRGLDAVSERLSRAERTQMSDQLAPLLTMSAKDTEKLLQMLAGASSRAAAKSATRRAATSGAASAVAGQQVRP
jgi:hypothetical protein